MGPDAMIFVFWMLSFKPTFSLSSFTFIKRLFILLLNKFKKTRDKMDMAKNQIVGMDKKHEIIINEKIKWF